MGTPSISTLTKMALKSGVVTGISDFSAGTAIEFLSEELRYTQALLYNNGIRGTRSRNGERCRIAQGVVSGSIVLHPTPTEITTLLPLILGSGSVLTEAVEEFGVLVDRVAKRFVYTGCRVSRATISGSQGQPITFRLDIEGETEVISASAFPSLTIDAGSPYIFSDTTFTLSADASAAEVRAFEIVIDNGLITDRFNNSVTRTVIPGADRMVMFNLTVPYTADEVDLHAQTAAGAAGTLTVTNGGTSTLFSFANLKSNPGQSPVIGSRGGEILLNLQLQAYKTDASGVAEIVITHDATP